MFQSISSGLVGESLLLNTQKLLSQLFHIHWEKQERLHAVCCINLMSLGRRCLCCFHELPDCFSTLAVARSWNHSQQCTFLQQLSETVVSPASLAGRVVWQTWRLGMFWTRSDKLDSLTFQHRPNICTPWTVQLPHPHSSSGRIDTQQLAFLVNLPDPHWSICTLLDTKHVLWQCATCTKSGDLNWMLCLGSLLPDEKLHVVGCQCVWWE